VRRVERTYNYTQYSPLPPKYFHTRAIHAREIFTCARFLVRFISTELAIVAPELVESEFCRALRVRQISRRGFNAPQIGKNSTTSERRSSDRIPMSVYLGDYLKSCLPLIMHIILYALVLSELCRLCVRIHIYQCEL
jgi:hypothetical protein